MSLTVLKKCNVKLVVYSFKVRKRLFILIMVKIEKTTHWHKISCVFGCLCCFNALHCTNGDTVMHTSGQSFYEGICDVAHCCTHRKWLSMTWRAREKRSNPAPPSSARLANPCLMWLRFKHLFLKGYWGPQPYNTRVMELQSPELCTDTTSVQCKVFLGLEQMLLTTMN